MYVEYKTSWEKRALAVLLAVVFVFVGMPYVGSDSGRTASADTVEPGDGVVISRSTNSKYMGTTSTHTTSHDSLGNNNGTYTGKILPITVNMYDYLTDAEISGTWNSLNDSAYTYYNRYNPYNLFDTEISNANYSGTTTTVSAAADNITFIYDPNGTAGSSDDMYVYLFNSTTGANFHSFPGDRMEKGADGKFRFTFIASDLENNTYDRIIFCNIYGYSNSTSKWQTKTQTLSVSQAISKGNSYTYKRIDWNNGMAVIERQSDGTADAITVTQQSPLYLGNFLARVSNDPTNNPHTDSGSDTNGKNNDAPNSYDSTNKSKISPTLNSGSYNNFFWQANISQRPIIVDLNKSNRTKSAVQGLVDSALNSDGLIAQNGTALPYFNSSWSGAAAAKGYMKYWESTDANPISFPFYELLNETSTSGQYARYYQFNSRDSTLLFNEADSDHTSAYFTERNSATEFQDYQSGTVQYANLNESIRAATKKVGYFPFNNTDSYRSANGSSGNGNNYGFGTMFKMTFKLKEDGKVDAVDSNGNTIRTGAQKVDTVFEFTGDDDLWVFIDDKLVLDMGGAHAASSGRINFASGMATVDNAVTYGTGGADNLGIVGSTKEVNIRSLLNGGYKVVATETNNPNDHVQNDLSKPLRSGYDPEVIHTMKIFYMERGMSESNLFIRFNFPAEPNYSKLKVKEQTDFSGINAGLKNLTKKAADVDVFRYLIENNGTTDDDVLKINAEYPTKENYIRTVNGVTTKLTSSTTTSPTQKSYYFTPNSITPDANGYKKVSNVSYNWVDENALKDGTGDQMKSNKNVGGRTSLTTDADGGGYMYLMYGTPAEGSADEIKSSGEFEGQFVRYSLLKVTQDNNLYTPSTHATNGGAAELNTTRYTTPRTVSDYYNETERYIFSTLNSADHFQITNGQAFNFRNNIEQITVGEDNNVLTQGDSTTHKDSNEQSPVIMTAQFVNAPKTGALSITKAMSSGTSDQEFTIKVRFEDIFGNTDADADTASDYTGILYNRYNSTDASRNVTNGTLSAGTVTSAGGAACGTFGIKAGEIVTIEKIPYNTKYTVYEEQDGFTAEYDNETGTIAVGSINSTSHKSQSSGVNNANNVTVTNTPEDENTLKIKEITSFTGVNSGLLSYTKKAAENDVFKYTISNQNTTTQGNSGYKYPTYDMYVRTSEADSNLKTTLTYSAPVPDTTHIYLDTSSFTNWEKDEVGVAIYLNHSNSTDNPTRKTVLMDCVTDHLFKVEISGYTKVQFMRIPNANIATDFPNGYYNGFYSSGWNPIRLDSITNGTTYEITDWGSVSVKTSTPVSLYPYSSNNYTPPNPNNGTVVANTTYLWTDDFASLGTNPHYDDFNYMTNKTDGSGNFYLMYGTPTSESSAFFLKQFTRGSIMTVEQSGTLTSPNGGNPDTLQGTAQRGTTDNNNSLDKYYSTKKELSGAGSADGELTGTNDFTYNNGGSGAINITETFTNTVNKGNLVISKEINPAESANDAKTNAVFKFRIKLTNVFGVTNNNVSNTGSNKYSGIEVTRTGYPSYSMTDVTDSGVDYGEFELQQGESLTINGIPYNTHYEIQEIGQTGNDPYYEFNSVKSTTDGGTNWTTEAANTVSGNIVAGQTKEFMYANKRKTGRLTLTKTLTGESNANTTVGNNTDFYFTVTLTEPIGVTFENNYADITGFNSATRSDSPNSDGCYTYTFSNISVKQQDGAKTIIQNIPYGTYYTVTENSDSNNPHVTYDGNTANAFASGIINTSSAVANATVNNMYRKVEMTKTDAKNSSKTIDGAHYKLLKLNSIFANVYENGSQQQKDDLAALFAGATSTSTLSTYLTNDESSELTTGNNGNVSVDDVTMANSLTDGYYFFFETAAATDYDIDNSLTSGKLIKIDTGDASSTYTVTAGNYTDPRKTGDLDLIKAFSTASVDTTPAAEFTYNVTLSVSESGVRLSDYLTQSYLESLTGIVTNTIIINDSTVTFQINIKEGAGNKVTITGLPVGTSFIVTEKTKTGWKQISGNADGMISVGTSTATITNARVGSLTLVKNLATGTDENTYKTEQFTYTVTLENSDSNIKLKDFIKNAQISGVESLDSTHYNDSHIEVDVTVTKQTPVTISNIPYGTTYSVSEGSKSGWAKETPVAADYSGTITSTSTVSDEKTATFTNAKTGDLVLSKSLLGGAPANPGSYTINVDLSNSPIALDGITLTAKDSSNANVTITHGSYSNSNKNHTISVPVSSGNNVTISGIPYGTSYTVTEAASSSTGTTNVEVTDNTSATKGTVDEDTSSVAVTNQYPCKLTLQKAITGTNAPASQHFTYHVTLSGMTGTYTIMNGSTEVGTNSTLNGSASFDVDMVAGTGVTISGIPYGTSYTVTEDVVANWTQTESSNTSGTINTAEITASFTNNYSNTPTAKTITLTKKDTSNTPLANVTFMLLKLKSSVSVDNSTVTDAFKNSTDYSSLSTYYDAAYGPKTTNSSGQVTFTEGQDGIANAAFASGDKYFFYEVSATDPNIILDNSLTQAKIIAIADGTSNYNVTYTNTKLSATVILTKIAKERVGTTSIGAPLKDAKFKVFKSDGTAVSGFADTYTTGEYGQLTVVGLPPGSYYFEEQTAPNGYSEIDSSTGQKRRVPFEINSTTTVINLSCSDEMAPAYIKLYEHINEKLSTNWGDPTFIFKITQTKYYDLEGHLTAVPENYDRSYTVALTVDDNDTWTAGLTGHSNPTYDYNTWLEESTVEDSTTRKYQGMFNINSDGSISLEPGEYQITRIPVQRYEFVENTWKLETDNDDVYTGAHRTQTETMTLTVSAGQTAIVHYYDKVAYYDKFTQVNTAINKFHKPTT